MCSSTLFFPKALNCRAPGELFTADLLMAQGVQTMTSIISILKYTHAYIHLHIITEETHANANTMARMRIYSVGTSHKRIRRENIYFQSITCHIGYSSRLIHLLRCADLSKTEGKFHPVFFRRCLKNQMWPHCDITPAAEHNAPPQTLIHALVVF